MLHNFDFNVNQKIECIMNNSIACITLLPEHGAEPQTSPSPFVTTPEMV